MIPATQYWQGYLKQNFLCHSSVPVYFNSISFTKCFCFALSWMQAGFTSTSSRLCLFFGAQKHSRSFSRSETSWEEPFLAVLSSIANCKMINPMSKKKCHRATVGCLVWRITILVTAGNRSYWPEITAVVVKPSEKYLLVYLELRTWF